MKEVKVKYKTFIIRTFRKQKKGLLKSKPLLFRLDLNQRPSD